VSDVSIPEGFVEMPAGLGFTDNLAPLYRRVRGQDVSFGLRVEAQHCNLMGICHGGALMTLADIAAATGINLRLPEAAGLPTINLSFDFISPGRLGRWLQTRTHHVEVKRRFGFCTGVVEDSDRTVMRYSGTFYLPEHSGMWKGGDSALSAARLFTGADTTPPEP
jgi:uncharacterized protein (TIGR00369 family)